MILDFKEVYSAPTLVWRAETNKRFYVIAKSPNGSYTAKVGTLKTGDQEDVFRGAETFQAAARACQAHVGG